MPEPPRKNETKKDFMSRCISYIITKEGKEKGQAWQICNSMWNKYKGENNMTNDEYREFTLTAPIHRRTTVELTKEKKTVECADESNTTSVNAVAIIGDKFIKGVFLPAVELEKVYKNWNGTLHDINHMGTTHPMGLGVRSDIRFFVGYQDNASYDEKTKAVSMDIHVVDSTLYSSAWRGFIELCERTGSIPNVSISFLAKVGTMKAKDLPSGVDYAQYGIEDDDVVEYIYGIEPRALSTVLEGACNDKDGCGIRIEKVNTNESSTCDCESQDYDEEEEKRKIITFLREIENND